MSYAHGRQVLYQKDKLNDGIKNTSDLIDILDPCTLLRIGALVTVIADASMTITVTRRVTTGNDANEVAIDSIIVPDTTAVGKVVYSDITPTDLNVGDQIEFAIANTGTSSAFQCFAVVSPRPEVPANQTDMVLTA